MTTPPRMGIIRPSISAARRQALPRPRESWCRGKCIFYRMSINPPRFDWSVRRRMEPGLRAIPPPQRRMRNFETCVCRSTVVRRTDFRQAEPTTADVPGQALDCMVVTARRQATPRCQVGFLDGPLGLVTSRMASPKPSLFPNGSLVTVTPVSLTPIGTSSSWELRASFRFPMTLSRRVRAFHQDSCRIFHRPEVGGFRVGLDVRGTTMSPAQTQKHWTADMTRPFPWRPMESSPRGASTGRV